MLIVLMRPVPSVAARSFPLVCAPDKHGPMREYEPIYYYQTENTHLILLPTLAHGYQPRQLRLSKSTPRPPPSLSLLHKRGLHCWIELTAKPSGWDLCSYLYLSPPGSFLEYYSYFLFLSSSYFQKRPTPLVMLFRLILPVLTPFRILLG